MRLTVLRPIGSIGVGLALAAAPIVGVSAQRATAPPAGVMVLTEPHTRLEAALWSTGALLVADYHRIDTRFGPNVRIEAVIVTIPETGVRVRGVRVQVPDEGRPGKPDSTSYVDADEIPALARALTAMSEMVRNWTGAEDRRATILSFTTTGGLRVDIREFVRSQRAVLSTGILEPVATGFEISDLLTLRQAFEQALAVLDAK